MNAFSTLASRLASAVLAVPFAVQANAPAQDAAQGPRGDARAPVSSETAELRFHRLDADEDGALALDEVASDDVLYRDFARWDSNKDGVINIGEFERYLDQQVR